MEFKVRQVIGMEVIKFKAESQVAKLKDTYLEALMVVGIPLMEFINQLKTSQINLCLQIEVDWASCQLIDGI